MIKVRRNTKIYGDETAGYEVILTRKYTVQQFIDDILTNKSKEWGNIGIDSKTRKTFGDPTCEYQWGKMISHLPKSYLNKEIVSVRGHGGWSLMNYWLKVK